jgi:hypothetical protein
MGASDDRLSDVSRRPPIGAKTAARLGLALVAFGALIGALVALTSQAVGAAGTDWTNWMILLGCTAAPLLMSVAVPTVIKMMGRDKNRPPV